MNTKLTWKEKTVIRILLAVACIVARANKELQDEIQTIANHISAGFGE